MRASKQDDHRAYRELDDIQSGAPLNAFNRPNYLRHPVITTQWERVLAILSLVFAASFLLNLALRSFG
jgi:hypothetical protein